MIAIIDVTKPGQIVILNGAPRSGKSSIVGVIQETFDGPWMNLGVDIFVREVTPDRYRPGMGLRPGDEVPELRPLVPALYRALYGSIAAHAREGLNVVADVGHYDRAILAECARIVAGLPVLCGGGTRGSRGARVSTRPVRLTTRSRRRSSAGKPGSRASGRTTSRSTRHGS